MAIIGIDVGGTKILGALFNKNGEIVDREKVSSKGEEGFDVLMNQIYKVIDELKIRNKLKIKGIGMGIPGIVDKNGLIVLTPNLPIENFDLAKHLKNKYNIPVKIGNDVNLGTLGEYKQLKKKHKNVIGVFPGTGLGGGFIINGDLYIGQGFAAEIGHIPVQKNGYLCGCGNYGCLECYASKKGIIHFINDQIAQGKETILKDDVISGVIRSSKLKNAYDHKDNVVLEAMNSFTDYLAMGLGTMMNMFNPDVIVLGGGVLDAFGDELIHTIIEKSKNHSHKAIFNQTKIRKSKLGDDAVIVGAYYLVK